VDPVPDPLLLRKSGCAGNRTRTSGSVARISDHYTEAGLEIKHIIYIEEEIHLYRLLRSIILNISVRSVHSIFLCAILCNLECVCTSTACVSSLFQY
jgi:hypothetical protein